MARPEHRTPMKAVPAARVAIVSPSFAAPALFPAVHELAMRRLRDDLGPVPVEYRTTRLLSQFPAIVVGRPKASVFTQPKSDDDRAAYVDAQRKAILARGRRIPAGHAGRPGRRHRAHRSPMDCSVRRPHAYRWAAPDDSRPV